MGHTVSSRHGCWCRCSYMQQLMVVASAPLGQSGWQQLDWRQHRVGVYTGNPHLPNFARILCCKYICYVLLQFPVKVVVQTLEITARCLARSLHRVVFVASLPRASAVAPAGSHSTMTQARYTLWRWWVSIPWPKKHQTRTDMLMQKTNTYVCEPWW